MSVSRVRYAHPVIVGQRVRIHPASDWFMRGAKYATVTTLRPTFAYVKLESIGPARLRVKLPYDYMIDPTTGDAVTARKLNPELVTRYRALRARYGYSAKQALSYAREPETALLDWDNRERATWDQAGFTITAKIEPDDNPDTSHLGTVNTSWDRDAIKVDPDDAYTFIDVRRDYERDSCYFHPTNPYRSQVKSLRTMGYSCGEADRLAREYVQSDFKRYRSWVRDDWRYVGIMVKASDPKTGITLGRASCWGFEFYGRNTAGFDPKSDSNEYLSMQARELASEAIADAKGNLDALKRKR